MLQIIKKDGVKGYENILRELCLENDESVSVSEALNGGKADGFGIYKLEPDLITVYKISDNNDLMLADGILRSILFLAASRGVEKAVFENDAPDIAKKLGLIKSCNILEPISDIFGGCESCKANALT